MFGVSGRHDLGTLAELAGKSGGGDFHAIPSAWMAFVCPHAYRGCGMAH